MKLKPTLLAAFTTSLCIASAHADFNDRPYELRLALSLDRLSAFTDVTARGGASTGHPLPSSSNPAANDFLRTPPFDFTAVLTASANYAQFDSGAEVLGLSTTALYRFPDAGSIRATCVYTDSLVGTDNSGFDQVLRASELFLDFSHRASDQLSLGAELHLVSSSLKFPVHTPAVPPVPALSLPVHSDDAGFDLTLGALYSPAPPLTLGLSAGAGRSSADVTIDTPLGPQPADSFIDSVNIRAGAGYKLLDNLGLYSDCQYRHLADDQGSIDVARLFDGAEFSPLKWLTLRSGGSVDSAGHTSASAGLGLYILPDLPIEFAYTYDAFPEIRPEAGASSLFSVSVVYLFR